MACVSTSRPSSPAAVAIQRPAGRARRPLVLRFPDEARELTADQLPAAGAAHRRGLAWRASNAAKPARIGRAAWPGAAEPGRLLPPARPAPGKRATMKAMTAATERTATAPAPRPRVLASLLCDLLPPQGSWSDDAYLWLTDHGNRPVELTDGHIQELPMPTDAHQAMLAFLYDLFREWLKPRGGVVRFSALRMRIREGKFREPDLLVLRDRSDPRRQDRYWLGADLVVEVVSPDDPDRDLVEKRVDYKVSRPTCPPYSTPRRPVGEGVDVLPGVVSSASWPGSPERRPRPPDTRTGRWSCRGRAPSKPIPLVDGIDQLGQGSPSETAPTFEEAAAQRHEPHREERTKVDEADVRKGVEMTPGSEIRHSIPGYYEVARHNKGESP